MSINTSYACFGCVPFAYNQRTLAYHRWACRTGKYTDPRCIPKLNWLCDCDNDDPEVAFEDPITDEVCWYDPLIPESADFLGIIIDKVSGLRSSTFTREVVDGIAGGSILQQPLIRGKQLVFNVYLLATSCAGMDYGIEWMRRQLEQDQRCPSDATTCASCQGRIMTLRVHCATPGEVADTGLHQFVSAGTIDGFTLVEDDYPMGRQCCCMLRKATFTIQTESADSFSVEPTASCSIDAAMDEIFGALGNCGEAETLDDVCCPVCALSTNCDPCTVDPACDCLPPYILEPETITDLAPCFADPVCRCIGALGFENLSSGYETALRFDLFAGWDPANQDFQNYGMRNAVIRIFENPEGLAVPDTLEEYEELASSIVPCAEIGISWIPAGANLIIDGLSGKSWLKCNGACVDHSERVFTISGSMFPLKMRCIPFIVTMEWDCLNVQQLEGPAQFPSSLTVETYLGFKL